MDMNLNLLKTKEMPRQIIICATDVVEHFIKRRQLTICLLQFVNGPIKQIGRDK